MENQFGKTSRLHLTAAAREGQTILEDVSFTAPFKVMRPFYEKKNFMTVMLLTASAGIMAGDRQEFDIRVKEDACMEFISQAYEKIHRMEEGFAARRAHLEVAPRGRLYYTPLPTIPFAHSDFRSTVEVHLADETSRFVLSEVLTSGRAAHGETFAYHRFQNRVSIYQGERLIYRDNTRYEPEWMDMRGFGMYEGFTHLANLVICNEPKAEGWLAQVREKLDRIPDVQGGATVTANGDYVVRVLGNSGQKLTALMEEILFSDL